MQITKTDGEWQVDESGCDASYVWWGRPPWRMRKGDKYRVRTVGGTWEDAVAQEDDDDEPTWVTSFCILDAGHDSRHRDGEGSEFDDGEERGGVDA